MMTERHHSATVKAEVATRADHTTGPEETDSEEAMEATLVVLDLDPDWMIPMEISL